MPSDSATSGSGPRICEPGGEGLVFPLGGDAERNWDAKFRCFLYGTGLLYSFVGVSVVADIFMAAIERVTSKKKRVPVAQGSERLVTKSVWNETVANLTLMALGSSAPEILLAINDVLKNAFFAGNLGPSTIVGSAAFNLFVIIAVCINAIPTGETRVIKERGVFHITAAWSIFAYLWLLFIVRGPSPNIIDPWEGVVTVVCFPLLVMNSYAYDVGLVTRKHLVACLCGCCCCAGKTDAAETGDELDATSDAGLLASAVDCVKWACKGAAYPLASVARLLCGCLIYFVPSRCQRHGDRHDCIAIDSTAEGKVLHEMAASDEEMGADADEVHVLDDDGEPMDVEEGVVAFKRESMEVWVGLEEKTLSVPVIRTNGTEGRVSVGYRMEGLSAVPDYDFADASGRLDFKSGVKKAELSFTLLPKRPGEQDDVLQLVLEEPDGGAVLDPTTDGGEDMCLLTVTLRNENPPHSFHSRMYHRFDGLLNMDELAAGSSDWVQQVKRAIYVNGSAEEQAEASWMDIVGHCAVFPWSFLYAVFTPPPTYLGGWICFVVALLHIGALTAIIGDLAELFGCAANIHDSITAITFVALGTSLPDTFASKAAATQDDWADASIVNVTGSNSVNVFLGIGLPWLLAALFWKFNGANQDWIDQYGGQYGAQYPNAAFVVNGAEDVAFSVMVFTVNALACLVVIGIRREFYGGELGGPSDPKACSSFLLILLWVSYIGLSMWKVENKDADIMEQIIAILLMVPIICGLMALFLVLLQVMKISKKYIGGEGFWGIFAAICVLGLRALVFFLFQMQS